MVCGGRRGVRPIVIARLCITYVPSVNRYLMHVVGAGSIKDSSESPSKYVEYVHMIRRRKGSSFFLLKEPSTKLCSDLGGGDQCKGLKQILARANARETEGLVWKNT